MTIVDRIELPELKTKHFIAFLAALEIADNRGVVIEAATTAFERAARTYRT